MTLSLSINFIISYLIVFLIQISIGLYQVIKIEMINYNIKKYFIFVLIITFFVPNYNNAKEILIYADNISYDDDENIMAEKCKSF